MWPARILVGGSIMLLLAGPAAGATARIEETIPGVNVRYATERAFSRQKWSYARIVARDDAGLLMEREGPRDTVRVGWADLEALEIKRPPRRAAGKGAVIGAALGSTLLVGAGLAFGSPLGNDTPSAGAIVGGTLVGGLVGGGIGALLGAPFKAANYDRVDLRSIARP